MNIEEKLGQLQEAKRRLEWEDHHTRLPKIQMVPHHLRNREEFAKYYFPRLVSFGPIHHGQTHLRQGEQYKIVSAAIYVEHSHKSARHLHQKVVRNIKHLKELYTEDAVRQLDDESLAWMLFVDGSSLLQILDKFDLLNPKALRVKADQLVLLKQDVLLLENQLPFQLLKLLSDHNDTKLIQITDRFLCFPPSALENPEERTWDEKPSEGEYEVIVVHSSSPPHLLDQLRRSVLREFHPQQSEYSSWITYRNVKELKAVGIRVKRCSSACPINISFSSSLFGGELRIPDLLVDETVTPLYLNLTAYEVCPDFENNHEISSYVEFLASIIDHPEDVKELRSVEVVHNGLGSDEEVANLFNIVSADLVPDFSIYESVRAGIEEHCKKKHRTWIAQAYHAYFSTSGTFIAFLAASLALLLTFLQTWFTIHPSK